MKKVILVLVAIVAFAVILLAFTSRNSMVGGGVSQASAEARLLERLSSSFLEDIKFKDFQKAGSYHSREERKKVDIPHLIERLFAIKPEFLDVMRYEIVKVEFDSSGKRCKVKTRTVVKILNTKEIKEPEIILYWFYDPAEGWVMELQSSLH